MYTQVASNKRKSVLLALVFIALVGGLGYVYGSLAGRPGIILPVFVFAVMYALVSYFLSTKIALGLAGAKPIAKKDALELYRLVENLSITAGLPMPAVYIIEDASPNAFATGRDPRHAVVAVTTGILQLLEKDELEGVLAHELSHVGNYDIRFMAIVMVLVTVITLVSDFFLRFSFFGGDDEEGNNNPLGLIIAIAASLVAPIVATLLQLAVSRKREYLADASGAMLTRYPEGLARALEKIGGVDQPLAHQSNANAHMYFSNPLAGKGGFVMKLFSTHPPLQDRIARLREMEGRA